MTYYPAAELTADDTLLGFKEGLLGMFQFSAQSIIAALAGFPPQAGHGGEALFTDGVDRYWAPVVLPTRSVLAGTGLTGGGTLAADRTFALATVGTAGTYPKVTTDAYGRVTAGSALLAADMPAEVVLTSGSYADPSWLTSLALAKITPAVPPATRLVGTSGGLQGGGDLSADRTLSLTDTGVAAGAYTELTVDVKGRVTAALATPFITASSTDTLTNKTFDVQGTGNTLSNLTTANFAANVVDDDATFAANSSSRLATQAATKSYVDNLLTGLSWKAAVRVATTTNGTLATAYENGDTVDGVVLATGDRVLLKNQVTGSENGIYVVNASGAPTRTGDLNSAAEFPGAAVFVREGTVNADTQWACTNDTVVVGTTAVVFAQVSGAGTYSAGTGLSLTGNQFSIDGTVVTLTGTQTLTNKSIVATQLTGTLAAAQFPALTGDLTTTAGSLATTLATVNSNVGTFNNITVNGKGLVTAASNVAYITASSTDTLTNKSIDAGQLTGTVPAARLPAFTGDATSPAGSSALTLATVNGNVGTFNNVTLNAKGLATAALNVAYITAGSTDTLTNKTFDAQGTGNVLSNLVTTNFAANVIDNDSTLFANSDTRLATQQATKSYVDNLLTGLSWKASVRVATTTNGALATAYENGDTVDGIVLATGDRILLKNQTTGSENGIYTVNTSGAPTRSSDANADAELPAATVLVREGTTNADTQWTCSNDAVTLGSTAITFVQVSGAGTYSAGTGLQLTGNQFSIDATVATLTGVQTLTNKSIVATQLTGTLQAAQFPALTGNITTTAGSLATTITAGAVTNAMLAGSIAASKLVSSDIVTVGTITTGVWNGSVVGPAYGGTGVANNAASTLAISGNFATTLTVTGTTGLTLPVTGTLATLAGTEELDNKTLDSSVGKGTWTASGTWTLPALTLGGTVSGGGNQINNVVIGTSTPLAGTFTTLIARQPGGVAGTDELQLSYDGTRGSIKSMDGDLRLYRDNSVLLLHTTGTDNTFLGCSTSAAGNLTMSGSSNIGIGDRVLRDNTTGNFNVAVGFLTLYQNTTGSNNVGIGGNNDGGDTGTLKSNTTGSYLTAVGPKAGLGNTTGSQNTYFGGASGIGNTTGSNNSAFGYGADTGSSGAHTYRTAIGSSALCTADNQVMLGTASETVVHPGPTTLTGLVTAAAQVRCASLGVGNSAAATVAVGALANKIEVFDAAGASLGFVPVYSTIT